MKHAKKFTCLAALTMSAFGATAHAETDDNYPWMQDPGATFGGMSVMSRGYSGGYRQYGAGAISSSTDVDYHLITCGNLVHPVTGIVSPGVVSSITLEFTHAQGDLDIYVYGVGGDFLGSSTGVTDTETVGIGSANRGVAVLKVVGYRGATGSYAISMVCK